jgi:hypothetical protein
MRGGPVAKIEKDLIKVAPAPSFRRVAFDDGMASVVKMLGGMPIRRAVAAADTTANPAEPKMHPMRTDYEAFLAPERAWRNVADAGDVRTFLGHQDLAIVAAASAELPPVCAI